MLVNPNFGSEVLKNLISSSLHFRKLLLPDQSQTFISPRSTILVLRKRFCTLGY